MSELPEVAVTEVPTDAVLLDVREDDEWAAGHAAGATHVPLPQLSERLSEVPAGDPVYVVCRSGGRSAKATEFLNANGWDAVNVAGGMSQWAATGKPIESASGTPEII